MAIDGDWNVVVKTPMGDQPQTVTFKTDGASFTGKHTNPLASVEIKDGKIDGDKLTWRVDIVQPMPLKCDIEAVVSGNTITGSVKTTFGAFPMQGARAG